MLVLSRHRDERIMISKWISIAVVDIRGDKVRLAIRAHQDVQIHRKEVYDAICREAKKIGEPLPASIALMAWDIDPYDDGGLVLSRKRNESIVINSNVEVVVVDIRGDKVRLGVEAPKDVPVHRLEVLEAVDPSVPWLQKKTPNAPTE